MRVMSSVLLRRAGLCLVVALSLSAVAGVSAAPAATTASVATFTPNVRADIAEGSAVGQNEPQVTVDQSGRTYVDWQSSPKGDGASSTTDGTNFTYLGNPDTSVSDVGDVAWATTSWPAVGHDTPVDTKGDNGVFFGTLGVGMCGAIEIRNSTTINQGTSWSPTDASCQPAQVDRDWMASYTPEAARGTDKAVASTWVYYEYHDFGASMIWVVRSSNGGATWDTVQYPAIQPQTAASGVAALPTSACNTIPSGIAVAQNGTHAGRVYVIWETSDIPENAQGCNYTQAQAFDHIFLSYSDDNGTTWTSTDVYNDPCAPNPPTPPTNSADCQDSSELFNSLAVDDAGNVYVAYVRRNLSESTPEYDVYVASSTDGGQTFTQHQVTPDGSGTHYMPWLAAGGNGGVDVVYYDTPYVEGVGQNNKPAAAPPTAVWDVYMSQSLDGGNTWVQSKVSDHHIYFGDICSTGIFCGLAPSTFNWGQDRILYDDFGVAIGPDGGARVAWTDARASWGGSCVPGPSATVSCQTTHVEFACQASGVGLHGETITGCGASSAPTAVRVARFQAQHAHGLVFRWRLADRAGVVGFNLYAGSHRLNAEMIRLHLSRDYQYRTGPVARQPYRLSVLLQNGQQVSIPSG